MQDQWLDEQVQHQERGLAEAARQLGLNLPMADVLKHHFANAEELERGAVFTREEVVDFMLDLAGYTSDKPLASFRILEPSFGRGDFLIRITHRLLASIQAQPLERTTLIAHLAPAIRAVEVHQASIAHTKADLARLLRDHGLPDHEIRLLLDQWIIEGDFLLVDLPVSFTHVVGNPPYVRQERIPDALLAEYRARYRTIYDRADLYIPFIERSLTHLATDGVCALICADRWTKNKYGGPLRQFIAEQYHLKAYIDMVDTDAFSSEVIAYPAITVLSKTRPGPTRVVCKPALDRANLSRIAAAMHTAELPTYADITEVTNVAHGREPWLFQAGEHVALLRRLEASLPTLEMAGCTVGIGVATGADKVFIGKYSELPVETSRKLPLVTTRDIAAGRVAWQGLAVVNPFNDDGTLVDLARFPQLAAYLHQHEVVIRQRNCAKKNQQKWYRTIDRIYPHLAAQPKLLVPDIKGRANIVLEQGRYYPHHNLYYVTSTTWDLRALQTVLRSHLAYLFVSTYSTKMRGGYIRFQAQYLRRIRLPRWQDIARPLQDELITLSEEEDLTVLNEVVASVYKLSLAERRLIEG
ncbi:Eco57I restriction-modification methylase domain-containing protein [Candidatus Chloroploca sp. M-50]|uniref:site-specific DNA-methyltransferase (adenine-specific) n=1 Tax=Candidatus Chloroploca mongolica TaxID=2528176 RepID=A0ABS4DFK9_9CHLR|nr:Eco57I restriction-modification methylase domain-containing protein [Candidatus Chloroploca mongolica]MBP1468221.1 Eco57I restriction-modification methylase domain-containing protein [Candidatus Chloroploca mongolica]